MLRRSGDWKHEKWRMEYGSGLRIISEGTFRSEGQGRSVSDIERGREKQFRRLGMVTAVKAGMRTGDKGGK